MPVSKEKINPLPLCAESRHTENAHLIMQHAHAAVTALLAAFDASRTKRRASGGSTTHAEQDLLRAMLVFAGAGTDAALKRLIQDTMSRLTAIDPEVRNRLQAFAARRLRDEVTQAPTTARGYQLLAQALVSVSPQRILVNAYVEDLIGDSLQSVERAHEAVKALGVVDHVDFDTKALKQVFADRNKIVHNMDMDLAGAKPRSTRHRTSRSRNAIIIAVNQLLQLGGQSVAAVASRMPGSRLPVHRPPRTKPTVLGASIPTTSAALSSAPAPDAA
jgi:hypothetical protein